MDLITFKLARRSATDNEDLLNLQPLLSRDIPTYPVLWAHDADRERTMVFEADHDGIPYRASSREEQIRVNMEVANVFATASHCHSNLDFQFDAQSTSMQFTRRKDDWWPRLDFNSVED